MYCYTYVLYTPLHRFPVYHFKNVHSLLLLGEQAMEGLTTRLPFGPRHIGLSDSTTIAILCALIELITESPQNAK